MSTEPRFEFLGVGDPRLGPSIDPARARARVSEAIWVDAERDAERLKVLDLIDDYGSTIADRSNPIGHLTGSALVVDPSNNHVLVMLHAKLNRWLQPGGHADGDHELAGVALREALEETGMAGLCVMVPAVDLDIHTIAARGNEPEHAHLDLRFVVVAPPGSRPERNHESLDMRWLSLDELRRLSDEPGLVRLARRGLEQLRRSIELGVLPPV